MISIKRVLRGILRINAGFAVVRIRSLGIVWPKKTDVDLIETMERKFGRN
ncbi:hypothetical protein [Thermococcus profundus]|nr:hypothetical protein [Thermococcus profundus]